MFDEIILRTENLTKRFPVSDGRVLTACDDVNLSVYKGKTLGIVGESGCGKSTLVKMLLNVVKPTEGAVYLDGVDISTLNASEMRKLRPKIQMVFQDPSTAFFPKMKVIDIVTEPLINFGRIKRNEKENHAAELLNLVELSEDFLYRYPHEMSGGQRQRVGIARALATEPEIIVCDEATSALDVSVQDKIMQLLVKLQREKGISIVFICHDVALVQSISHRIAVMYLGNVVEILDGNELKCGALHPYTEALTGALFSIHMDFEKEIKSIEGEAPSPLNVPDACPFQNRCKFCMDICRVKKPLLKEVKKGHMLACHLTERHIDEGNGLLP